MTAVLRPPGKGGGRGGPDVGGADGDVLGGSGGGAADAGGMAFLSGVSREVRDGGCRGARLGGGGGAPEDRLSPWKGGGTPNLGFNSSSSSMGVLGGRGGGGGPGLATFDTARFLFGRVGAGACANFPASARGGGALN